MNSQPYRKGSNQLLPKVQQKGYGSFNYKSKSHSIAPQENDRSNISNKKKPAPIEPATWSSRLFAWLMGFFLQWLKNDAELYDEPGKPICERQQQTAAGYVRRWVYDSPNKKIVNQYTAALVMGTTVGVVIIPYKWAIEFGLDVVWEHMPEYLETHGYFETIIPSYCYTSLVMVTVCVATGLAFDTQATMPDQNSLLADMEETGRISSYHLWQLVFTSVLAMWGGLPLGPELPLLLIFAMFASAISEQLGLSNKQSRFLLYYSQSAAIGAFFSYPIGAFFFVMELPLRMGFFHRMGNMHAELLGPCAVASLAATLVHCHCTGTPVQRMFDFPLDGLPKELTNSLPLIVIVASVLGTYTGMVYAAVVKWIKVSVHGISDVVGVCDDVSDEFASDNFLRRTVSRQQVAKAAWRAQLKFLLHGVVCAFVGFLLSIICMIFPHCFSWGEAQMQNLLDKGTSSLPFFDEDSPLLSPFALCIATADGGAPSIWCMAVIPLAKIVCIGLVLGTGIRCGHFWGPVFVAAAVGQFALSLGESVLGLTTEYSGMFLLCFMASAHVVTFRSPIGIALLLMQSAGYDIIASVAVICAAHISLHLSGDLVIFYKAQKDHQTPLFEAEEERTFEEDWCCTSTATSSMAFIA